MKAMILAAGRGGRMGALTDETPKPLLPAGGQTLIEYHLKALAEINVRDVIINACYFSRKFQAFLGDGRRYGLTIHYSLENDVTGALDTGGGVLHALPMLGDEPFILLNGDIWTDYPFRSFPSEISGLAHLIMVDNPAFRPKGDFTLEGDQILSEGKPRFTYGCMAVIHPQLFIDAKPGRFSIVPLIKQAVQAHQVTGEYHRGNWFDIGAPERYYELQAYLSSIGT